MNKDQRMKFVAGEDLQFLPRSFAQKFFYKMGEEYVPMYQEKFADRTEENSMQVRSGKMIFKEGADNIEETEVDYIEDEERSESLQQPNFVPNRRPPQRPPQGVQTAELSRDIYNQMLILRMLEQDLLSFNTSFSDELRDMIEELIIIIFAMGRIVQTLSRNNRLPIQNRRKPQIRDFCSGVVVTSNFLRGLLYDLRLLERINQNQNIDNQLIIIYLTLQSQQSQLQEMRQDCIEGGRL